MSLQFWCTHTAWHCSCLFRASIPIRTSSAATRWQIRSRWYRCQRAKRGAKNRMCLRFFPLCYLPFENVSVCHVACELLWACACVCVWDNTRNIFLSSNCFFFSFADILVTHQRCWHWKHCKVDSLTKSLTDWIWMVSFCACHCIAYCLHVFDALTKSLKNWIWTMSVCLYCLLTCACACCLLLACAHILLNY